MTETSTPVEPPSTDAAPIRRPIRVPPREERSPADVRNGAHNACHPYPLDTESRPLRRERSEESSPRPGPAARRVEPEVSNPPPTVERPTYEPPPRNDPPPVTIRLRKMIRLPKMIHPREVSLHRGTISCRAMIHPREVSLRRGTIRRRRMIHLREVSLRRVTIRRRRMIHLREVSLRRAMILHPVTGA